MQGLFLLPMQQFWKKIRSFCNCLCPGWDGKRFDYLVQSVIKKKRYNFLMCSICKFLDTFVTHTKYPSGERYKSKGQI